MPTGALGARLKISCSRSTLQIQSLSFMFFALLTSREAFLQNCLPKHLYRELLWLQISHCLYYVPGIWGLIQSRPSHEAAPSYWFQYAWVGQGLITSEQGSVSTGNAYWVKKQGDSFEYLWTEKLKIWKGLCALSLCRAAYIFSFNATTASATDEADTNQLSSSLMPLGRMNRLLSQRSWGNCASVSH